MRNEGNLNQLELLVNVCLSIYREPYCVLLPNTGEVPAEQQTLEIAVVFWSEMANISDIERFNVLQVVLVQVSAMLL